MEPLEIPLGIRLAVSALCEFKRGGISPERADDDVVRKQV
jgi:hypothetical protein